MNKNPKSVSFLRIALTILALVSCVSVTQAHPYASGITNDGAGNIRFILNEAASTVTVLLTNNGTGVSSNLTVANGGLPSTIVNKGLQTFSVIRGATTFTNYAITVAKAGSSVITKISTDSNPLVNFFGPRGVAVNQNAASKNFGRTYVGNSAGGNSVTTFGGVVRSTGRGLYIINADQTDAIGKGTNASAAGITFSVASSGTTYSPYRLNVGSDDTVYLADAMTNTCQLWKVDADATTSTAILGPSGLAGEVNGINTNGFVPPGDNHGRISSKPIIFGTPGNNLTIYTIDTDYTNGAGVGYNHIMRYDIGNSAFPYLAAPTILADNGFDTAFTLNDLANAGTNFYTSVYRANDTDTGGSVKIFDATGTTLVWHSFSNSIVAGHDPFVQTQGMAVSPDGQYLATIRFDGSNCVVHLTNGIPDLSTLVTNALNGGSTARSVCWDAADNFYVVSGGSDLLRVFSLGLSTTAITTGDTIGTGGNNNGTFTFTIPQTTVNLAATTPLASQGGFNGAPGTPVAGVFTLTRAGQNLNQPLTVSFTLSGTATNAEYVAAAGASTYLSTNGAGAFITNTITFAANETSTNITITPVDDGVPRLTNTVILTVLNSTTYSVTPPGKDTVFIQNTDAQKLVLVAGGLPTMYKAYSNDFASFVFQRLGDATVSYTIPAASFHYTGTAVANTDFVPGGDVFMAFGQILATNTITPLVNGQPPAHSLSIPYVGNKSIVASIAAGTDPNTSISFTSTSATAALTLVDNAYPAAQVLFSDPLTDPNDVTNWTFAFANGNLAAIGTNGEYLVDFGFNLASGSDDNGNFIGAIPPPPSGASTALRMTVNKNSNPSVFSAAGVNAYLKGYNFTSNYAVRFEMNLIQGFNISNSTEGALFGINHNGVETNWWTGSALTDSNSYPNGWAADGVWYWITSDANGAGGGDFIGFTGAGLVATNRGWVKLTTNIISHTNFVNQFKDPAPFTTVLSSAGAGVEQPVTGLPANGTSANANLLPPNNDTAWADVEIKQVNNVVTWSINKTAILIYTNTLATTSLSTNGTVMLGYDDPFNSFGTYDGAVYFSDLKVVQLGPPFISSITLSPSAAPTTTTLVFTSNDGDDTTASFALQRSTSVAGGFTDVSPAATFTQNPTTGAFSVTTPYLGSTEFYRVRHK